MEKEELLKAEIELAKEKRKMTIGIDTLTRVVVAGASTTFTATATLTSGATQRVFWSASVPAGATYSFNPASGYPTFSSTFKIKTPTTIPAEILSSTLTGTGPSGSHSTDVTLKISNASVNGGIMSC